jgi:hypothetical protein
MSSFSALPPRHCSSCIERSVAAVGAFTFALPSLFLKTRKSNLPWTKRLQKKINYMKIRHKMF